MIRARYRTSEGGSATALLLASGWWGFGRHFRFVPELAATLAWSVAAGFEHFMPYFYVVFLAILLVHRAHRIDHRCARKYGQQWDAYCRAVPYRMIPGVY